MKDQLLIELTHTPLALDRHRRRLGTLAGIAARSAGQPVAWQIARWLWPVCFILVGLMLLNYREA